MGNPEYQEKEIPKTEKEQEISSVKKEMLYEIKELWSSILSEKAKDPDIKNATEKIIAGCLKWETVNILLNQENFENKKVSLYINQVIKTNPELWLFIQKLWIPNFMGKKYEQLLVSQKIALLALDDTINGNISKLTNPSYKNEKGKFDNKNFEKAYIKNVEKIIGQLGIDFQLTQVGNFWKIKTTLKEDYGLTEKEASKYIAYLETIKNQPSKIQESWIKTALYLAGVVTGILLTTLGVVFYNQFTNAPTQTVIDGKLKLGSPELIARLLSEDIPFEATWVIEKAQFQTNDDENQIIGGLKKLINMGQTRKLTMQVNGKVAVEFDFDNSKMEYDPAKKTIFVVLKTPKTIIHESSSKIMDDNTQIWQTKDFTNIPMQLQDSLLNAAKNDVQRNTLLIEQARKNAENILMALYSYPLEIAGQKLDSVHVEIFDANNNIIPNKGRIEPPNKPMQINHK